MQPLMRAALAALLLCSTATAWSVRGSPALRAVAEAPAAKAPAAKAPAAKAPVAKAPAAKVEAAAAKAVPVKAEKTAVEAPKAAVAAVANKTKPVTLSANATAKKDEAPKPVVAAVVNKPKPQAAAVKIEATKPVAKVDVKAPQVTKSAPASAKAPPAVKATPAAAPAKAIPAAAPVHLAAHAVSKKSEVLGPLDTCGEMSKFPNAEPKNYEDAMPTKFNKETKKREPVTFKKGDSVDFKCKAGFTLDGSKDGDTEFPVVCSDTGFFKPKGVCMKASKCGAVPVIPHATATAVEIPGKVQFGCNPGFSLDGEKVVAGGMGKNSLFTLECVEFSGTYEKFKGECKPYAFMPAKETTRIYTQVFEALFVVTCQGKITEAFGKGESAPVDAACAKLVKGSGSCAGLVSDIKAAFETKKKALKSYKEKEEWWDTKGKPGVTEEASTFCKSLWKLVEKPNDL